MKQVVVFRFDSIEMRAAVPIFQYSNSSHQPHHTTPDTTPHHTTTHLHPTPNSTKRMSDSRTAPEEEEEGLTEPHPDTTETALGDETTRSTTATTRKRRRENSVTNDTSTANEGQEQPATATQKKNINDQQKKIAHPQRPPANFALEPCMFGQVLSDPTVRIVADLLYQNLHHEHVEVLHSLFDFSSNQKKEVVQVVALETVGHALEIRKISETFAVFLRYLRPVAPHLNPRDVAAHQRVRFTGLFAYPCRARFGCPRTCLSRNRLKPNLEF